MRRNSHDTVDRYRKASRSQLSDPFAVDPIRRSAYVVVASLLTIIVPFLISSDFGIGMMFLVGWLAVTGIIFCGPILIWSLIEEGIRRIRQRMQPPIEELSLSSRLIHVLSRHGYHTIREVDRAGDTSLILLSNMEPRDVQQIRRAINLWKYARWQEQGFPAVGYD